MKRLSCTLSLLALTVASPALAETLAADLWAEWQVQAEMTEQTITATVTETDTGLILSNLRTAFNDGDVMVSGMIDLVELTENPDGTVTVTYSDVYAMTLTFDTDPGSPPGNVEIQIRHENLNVQVSGDPGARVYAYTADTITVTDGLISGGDGPPPQMDLNLVVRDIDTTYSLTGTDPEAMRFTSDGSLGGMTMVLEISAPEGEEGSLKAGLQMGPMQSTSEGTLVSLGGMGTGEDGLPDGFDLSANATYGSFGLEMIFAEPGNAFEIAYSNDGGTIDVEISPEALAYGIAASGAQAAFTSSDMPVPFEASTGSSEITFVMPVAAGDAPQDMSLRLGVQDLVLGEGVMAMIDPTQAVPRTPTSLLLDVTGQVQLFMDLMNINPDELTGPPGELRAITVNDLRLSAAGAELSGTADLTFAPNQLIPMPVGTADLQLSGGNGLMQALVAGGMVPAAQSGMIMGMANVFARPGAAPDTLETTVEFGPNGSITANGIPLQ